METLNRRLFLFYNVEGTINSSNGIQERAGALHVQFATNNTQRNCTVLKVN